MIKKSKLLNDFLIILVSAIFLFQGNEAKGVIPKATFVIVYPGGPNPGTEGKKIIDQFVNILSEQTDFKPGSIQGVYFNDSKLAENYLKRNRNSFIMASLGFYLSRRESFKLLPLLNIETSGGNKEEYSIIVKKGKYSSLDSLKGKILSGNILYEDIRYINKIIFNNKLDANKYFVLKPTVRPLSAVRKVVKDVIDAVLVNKMQFESLKRISSTYSKIDTVYKSQQYPILGFMMMDSPRTQNLKDKIVNAVMKMTKLEEGRKVCQNFNINGFVKVEMETFDEIIEKFDSSE